MRNDFKVRDAELYVLILKGRNVANHLTCHPCTHFGKCIAHTKQFVFWFQLLRKIAIRKKTRLTNFFRSKPFYAPRLESRFSEVFGLFGHGV